MSVPRIGDPGLAVDRHHVGMARQHDAAFGLGADRGEEVGLGALGVGHQRARHAVAVEIVLDVLDQLEVGVARGGVERHEALQHVDRTGGMGTHAGTVARFMPGAKSLISLAKLGSRLTPPDAAARTARASVVDISIAGVLTGCGEVAERSKAAVC